MADENENPLPEIAFEASEKEALKNTSPHTPSLEEWNCIKKVLHNKDPKDIPYFYEREIWWCCLGMNVGYEEDGKNSQYSRPVVILRIFNREIFFGIPVTTNMTKTGKYYHWYEYEGIKYNAILSQLRLLSSRRLIRKVGVVPKESFDKMRKRIKHLI